MSLLQNFQAGLKGEGSDEPRKMKILKTVNFSLWGLILASLLVMIIVMSNIDVIDAETEKNMDAYESRAVVKNLDFGLIFEIITSGEDFVVHIAKTNNSSTCYITCLFVLIYNKW